MAWQRTTVSHPSEPRTESELKRLRAYEGLVVVVVVIAAVLVFGGTVASAMASSLGDIARALSG